MQVSRAWGEMLAGCPQECACASWHSFRAALQTIPGWTQLPQMLQILLSKHARELLIHLRESSTTTHIVLLRHGGVGKYELASAVARVAGTCKLAKTEPTLADIIFQNLLPIKSAIIIAAAWLLPEDEVWLRPRWLLLSRVPATLHPPELTLRHPPYYKPQLRISEISAASWEALAT